MAPSGRADQSVIAHAARTRLTELFDDHESRVFGFLLARTGDRALAEDLTTETFLSLARRAAREPSAIEGISASSMITIARRRLIDHWRSAAARRRRLEALRVEASASLVDTTGGSRLDEMDERVIAALDSLSVRQRAALTLHHMDEMPISEVADVLGTSYQAAESILARARRGFRAAYEDLGGV